MLTDKTKGSTCELISKLNLPQTGDLLYRCDGSDPEDGWLAPALMGRVYGLVGKERGDRIMRVARSHYGFPL